MGSAVKRAPPARHERSGVNERRSGGRRALARPPDDVSLRRARPSSARLQPDTRGADMGDVVIGCALPEGAQGNDIARMAAVRAGLPVSVAGATVNRFCSSGLQTIAMAAQQIKADGRSIIVAGGVESISTVQNTTNRTFFK